MKPFSALTLALLTLPLVVACTAQVTPPATDDTSTMNDSFSSSVTSGPYLEDDSTTSEDAVELNVHASSVSSTSSSQS